MWVFFFFKRPFLCIRGKAWQIIRVVDELAGSPKFWVHVPKFTNWYNILDITGSDLSCSLVFNVQVTSFALNPDDSVSCSPFEVPFSWGFVFEVYSISNLESWFCSVVFSAVRNLWSSKYFLAMDNDN